MHLGALFARFRHSFAVAGNADWVVLDRIIKGKRKMPCPVP